jgi:hypothetical protein
MYRIWGTATSKPSTSPGKQISSQRHTLGSLTKEPVSVSHKFSGLNMLRRFQARSRIP